MELLIADLIRRNGANYPNRVAASDSSQQLTHGDLDREANRLAHALSALGVTHGDRVLMWMDTALAVLPLFAATSKLGAALAPLNARWGEGEALPVARSARASILITDAARAEAGARIAAAVGIPRIAQLAGAGPGVDLAEAARAESDADYKEPALRESDTHVLFFTSGSTGTPKGVVLSHRANWLRSYQGVFRDVPESTVCMFPLFHMAGFTLAMAAWQTGGEIILSSADPVEILKAVDRRKANRLYLLPSTYARVLEQDLSQFDLASLREVDTGTSAVPLELVHAMKEHFPECALRIYYGSTECGSAASLADVDCTRKPGSVGQGPAGVFTDLAEDGEIRVRSPYLMDGYFENPEATAEVLRDGWFYTGDLGAFDDEGYLSIVGRKKEIIRTGGESVAPTEVEAVLGELPAIEEVAVVGLPDAEWGEVVTAVVVVRPESRVDLEAIQAHCASRLAGFKKPRRLEFLDSLPRTAATRQIQRTLVVERVLSEQK